MPTERIYLRWIFGPWIFVGAFLAYTVTDVFGPYWNNHFGIKNAESFAIGIGALSIACCTLLYVLVPSSRNKGVRVPPVKDPWIDVKEIGDPLLILRVVAFLCVWMTHSALLLKPNNTDEKWWHFLTFGCAHQGMAIFFTLSGYLMGKAFACGRYAASGSGIRAFYKNRILRIVPLYIFAQIVVLLLVRPELLTLSNWASMLRLVSFTYYSSPSQSAPIGALWSLSTEMQFYLLVPFLFIMLRSGFNTLTRAFIAIIGVLAIGLFLRVHLFHLGTDWQVHRYTPLYINLDLFLCGMFLNGVVGRGSAALLARFDYRFLMGMGFLFIALLYLCASAFTASSWAYFPFSGKSGRTGPGDILYEYGPTLTAIATLCIIFCFETGIIAAANRKAPRNDLGFSARIMKRTEYLGLITYGLYIWHTPVLEAFNKVLQPASTTLDYFVRNVCILLFGVFSLSIATYIFIELPFAKLKKFARGKGTEQPSLP